MQLAATINTSNAITWIATIAAILIAVVGLSIIAMGFGSRGGASRKIAEKVFAVVVGASLIVGATVWATVNIFSGIVG